MDKQIEDFHDREGDVVSTVPEPRARVADWQATYDLSFPLLVDGNVLVPGFDERPQDALLGTVCDGPADVLASRTRRR